MISKVKDTISKYNMIEGDDKVFVAVSGGADSVCLLLVLQEFKSELGFELEAIHVEHGIRGEESLKDAAFVRKLCEDKGIKLHEYSVDVLAYVNQNNLSVEEAARKLRYESFDKHIDEGKIAIAHHMEDNAETMIFNMVRGSGIDGIRGIKKKRGNIIRPLIECSRAEIIEYLSKNNQEYCTDSTNEELDYTRNNIRHNIMPKLIEVNSSAIEHLNNLSRMQDMAVDYIEKCSDVAYEKYVSENRLSKEILNEELIIVYYVSHKFLCNMAGSAKDISNVHVEALIDLLKNSSGRKKNLPYNLVAISNYDCVEIVAGEKLKDGKDGIVKINEEVKLEKYGDKATIHIGKRVITLEVMPYNKELEIISKNYTKTLDYDKITSGLCIRNRRENDYLIINSKGSKKSLNRYMIDEKIPAQNRDDIVLVCDGNHVMYVVGHRISEHYKITDKTKTIIKIEVLGEGINE